MVTTYATPLGAMLARWDGAALTELRFTECPTGKESRDALGRWLAEYFAGRPQPNEITLAPGGTNFQRRVWELVARIPRGKTRTYGDIAHEMGDRHLARAVGAANGANPIALLIPCHRVIGAGNDLTGYAYGLSRKAALLQIEGFQAALGL